MDAAQRAWVQSLEDRILAAEKENGRLWRYYRRLKVRYDRIANRLPEGRAWERGSRLIIPRRPTAQLKALGLLKDDRR